MSKKKAVSSKLTKRGKHSKEGFFASKKVPIGIKILFGYSLFLILINLLFALFLENVVFFGFSFSGVMAKTVYVLFAVLLGIVLYGFVKRGKLAFYYALFWYCISIIDSFVSLFAMKFVDFNSSLFLAFMLTVMLINGLTLGYVSMKKDYFVHKLKVNKTPYEDKLFVGVLSVFVLFLLVFGIYGGLNFYKNTKNQMDIMSVELQNSNILEAEVKCASMTDEEADVCYMVLANSVSEGSEYCSYVTRGFYRFICERAMNA